MGYSFQPANPFQCGLNSLLSCLAAVCEDISEGIDLANVTLVKGNLNQRMGEGIAVATRTSLEVVRWAKCLILFYSKGSVLLFPLKQGRYRCLACIDLRNQVKAVVLSGSFTAAVSAGGVWAVLLSLLSLVTLPESAHHTDEMQWSCTLCLWSPWLVLEFHSNTIKTLWALWVWFFFFFTGTKQWDHRGGSGITPRIVNTN